MSESPEARWTSPDNPPSPLEQRRLPPTPSQRRMGIRIGLGLMLLVLLVIALLDHYGILH
jgi:hypothetical protein